MTAAGRAFIQEIQGKSHKAKVMLPLGKGSYPIYYLLTAEDDIEEIWQHLANKQLILVKLLVEMERWNHDMSPWKAPALNMRMPEFTGGASDYLKKMEDVILPDIEKSLKKQGYTASARGIAGYSMGGLFAFYTMTKTQLFSQAASVSGSLWYEGFLDYMKEQLPSNAASWYLSLGNREAKTKNVRMAQVEHCTLEMADLLKKQARHSFYEYNEGGHFQDIPLRMAKAIDYLNRQWIADINR